MVNNFGVAPDMGYFNRKITDLQRQIESLRSERRAAATTITDGDFTLGGGGSLNVNDGGQVVVRGGQFRVELFLLIAELQSYGIRVSQAFTTWVIDVGHIGPNLAGISANEYPIHLTTPTNDVRLDHTTTASAANAYLDSVTKRISRSTSSLRYKQDIEDHWVGPALVLAMQARSWRDRAEVEEDPDTERRYVGFIAEELHDLGLTEFVVYDADGKPEAIAYDRLSVALLAVLKDHDQRLTALEETIDALKQCP